MRIGYLSTAYHTSHIIRAERLLEKSNIEAEWHLFGGGPAIVEKLSDGSLDLGYVGLPPVIMGISEGTEIKCIAGGHQEGSVFIVSSESKTYRKAGVREVLSQFSKIATPPRGSIHDVIARCMIRKYSLKVEVVNYPWADQILDDIVDGEIKAAMGTPSLAVLAMEYADARVALPPSMLWKNNPSYGIVVREDLLESKEVLKFLEIHEDTSNLLRLEPERAAGIVSRALEILPRETVEKIIGFSPRYCASLSKEFVESTLAFISEMKSLGYIKRDIQKEDIFHFKLIEKVHREEAHY